MKEIPREEIVVRRCARRLGFYKPKLAVMLQQIDVAQTRRKLRR